MKYLFFISIALFLFFVQADQNIYTGSGALVDSQNWSWAVTLGYKSNPKTNVNSLYVTYPASTNQYPGFYANLNSPLQKSSYQSLSITLYSTVTPKLQICFNRALHKVLAIPLPFQNVF